MDRVRAWRPWTRPGLLAIVLIVLLAGSLIAVSSRPGNAAAPAALPSPTAARHRAPALDAQPEAELPAALSERSAPTPAATVQATAESATPTPVPMNMPVSPGQTIRAPILMYHYIRVNPVPSDALGFALSVTPNTFARQMRYLSERGYHTITLDELSAVLRGQAALPSKPIVLTFDDGYRDFYTSAFPVLRQYGMKSTSFVITGLVGSPRYLTWGMIEELWHTGLVSFGSHTVHHVDLSAVPLSRAATEIEESQRALEAHLGAPVRSFAYPSGKYTPQVIDLLRQLGFEMAVTELPGASQRDADRLTLRRIRMDGRDSFATFVAKLEVR